MSNIWKKFAKVGQARAWAGIWKMMAKAYRAMSLSQQDALARYARWIDPAVELPELGKLVAILRYAPEFYPDPFVVLGAYVGNGHWQNHGDPSWLMQRPETVIGWHPLPELPDLARDKT